jgi:tetratricopeptide (TPR) repeat protein
MQVEDDIEAKVLTAQAMLGAGNLNRAKDLAQQVLKKQDDNLDAFEVLYDVRLADQSYGQALALCLWRLERLPNCPYAAVFQLHSLCLLKRKREATQLFKTLQDRLGNHPFHLEQARIYYAYHFWPPSKARKLIQASKEKGYFDPKWLETLEADTRAESGHIYTSRKMMNEALAESPNAPDLLYALAVTNVLTGRLPTALKQAKQAKEVDPPMAPAYNEVVVVATLGLIPIFWGAMTFIILNASVATRLPWLIRIPFNYLFMALGIGVSMIVPIAMDAMNMNVPALNAFILLGNIGFAIYLLFGFQHVGMSRARKKQNFNFTQDY